MTSKITQIQIENFMAYSNAVIDFDEQGIINLKGYSDSGKSAFLIAIAVCFDNYMPSKQAKFIKDGCKYFKVSVSFDDSVKIVRYKYSSGKSLYEMFKDGSLVYTSKINGSFTPIREVPEVIANYLQLTKLKSGVLNFRTNQDKQFLAQTTGSENFEDLNNLFGIEEILWAIETCKSEISAYNTEMINNDAEIKFYEEKQEEYKDISQNTLVKLMEESGVLSKKEESVDVLKDIQENTDLILKFKETPEIEEIVTSADKLISLSNYLDFVSKPVPDEVGEINSSRVKYLDKLNNLVDEASIEIEPEIDNVEVGSVDLLIKLRKALKSVPRNIPEFEEIGGINQSRSLIKLLGKLTEFEELENKTEEIEKERDKYVSVLNKVKVKLKSKGYVLHECSNCGNFEIEGV